MQMYIIVVLAAIVAIVFLLRRQYVNDMRSMADEELDEEIKAAVQFYESHDDLLAERARRAKNKEASSKKEA